MGLTNTDWFNIDRRIEDIVRKYSSPTFAQGQVIKADPHKNLIWLKEFGDQPIPVFTFDYNIKYYDTQPTGNVTAGQPVTTQLIPKQAVVTPKCPVVGDIVLIAKQYGSRSLPKCIGVLRSRDFEALTE